MQDCMYVKKYTWAYIHACIYDCIYIHTYIQEIIYICLCKKKFFLFFVGPNKEKKFNISK